MAAANLILPQLANANAKTDRIATFWAGVDRRGDDECWPWMRQATTRGYGRFSVGKKLVPAHRFAWVITHGVDPDPFQMIMHKCDNPPCCNPAHLRVGTHRDNVDDMFAKGRAICWGRPVSADRECEYCGAKGKTASQCPTCKRRYHADYYLARRPRLTNPRP